MKRTRRTFKSLTTLIRRHSDWAFYHPSFGRLHGFSLGPYERAHNRTVIVRWNPEYMSWDIIKW